MSARSAPSVAESCDVDESRAARRISRRRSAARVGIDDWHLCPRFQTRATLSEPTLSLIAQDRSQRPAPGRSHALSDRAARARKRAASLSPAPRRASARGRRDNSGSRRSSPPGRPRTRKRSGCPAASMRKSIEKQSRKADEARKPCGSIEDRGDRAGASARRLAGADRPSAERRPPAGRAPKPPRAPGVSFAPESVSLSFIVRNAPPVSLAGFLTMRSTPIWSAKSPPQSMKLTRTSSPSTNGWMSARSR